MAISRGCLRAFGFSVYLHVTDYGMCIIYVILNYGEWKTITVFSPNEGAPKNEMFSLSLICLFCVQRLLQCYMEK